MLWVNICSAVGELSFFFATVLFQTHYISLSHDHWSIESIWCYHYPCSACPAQTVLCSAASCLGIIGSPVAPKSPSLRRRPALASPRNGRARLLLRQVKICSSEIRDLQSAAGLTTVPQTQILPFRSRFSQSWHHIISFFFIDVDPPMHFLFLSFQHKHLTIVPSILQNFLCQHGLEVRSFLCEINAMWLSGFP